MLTLPEMVLRHELAHAVMTRQEIPNSRGRVQVRVRVKGREVYGFSGYPTRLNPTPPTRARIALAGPAYCELIGAPHLGAARDLQSALKHLGTLAAVRAELAKVRIAVAEPAFRGAVEERAATLLSAGSPDCDLSFFI